MFRAILLLAVLLSSVARADAPIEAWEYREDMLESAWEVFGLNAPTATLAAQIHQESAWRLKAKSWAGAEGFAQFMPTTAKDMAERFPEFCAPADPYDPQWAFRCRDRYLQSLKVYNRGAGLTECDTWAFKLRAYNGGGKWTSRDRNLARDNGVNPDDWKAVTPFNSGRKHSAWKENTEYPRRIYLLETFYTEWGRGLGCL